jgi:tellurite resistance protein TehA-like permease
MTKSQYLESLIEGHERPCRRPGPGLTLRSNVHMQSRRLRGGVHDHVRTLDPGYFALVMATGIVSIAMQADRADAISALLLWLAAAEYGVLVVLNVWRVVTCWPDVAADVTCARRGLGLFTFVAGTNVLGARLVIDAHHDVGLAFLGVGSVAWLLLGYGVPWLAVLGHTGRPLLRDADGTWFIWVVASQSIAVLSAALEPTLGAGHAELGLLAVFCWAVGVFLYAATGIFVAARMLLYPLRPADLTLPYWVAMGATAITVVAGATITRAADTPAVAATRDVIAATSVIFWVFGTWLIPPLVAAVVWRYLVHKVPLRYDVTLWSVVFPLGMYGVAGHYLGQADDLPIVKAIGVRESWVALAAWIMTFAAMLWHLVTALRSPGPAGVTEPEGRTRRR